MLESVTSETVSVVAQDSHVVLDQWVCIVFFQLSAEQRAVMCGHRERAVQREVDRQNQQRNKLLARVQDILGQAQVSSFLYTFCF